MGEKKKTTCIVSGSAASKQNMKMKKNLNSIRASFIYSFRKRFFFFQRAIDPIVRQATVFSPSSHCDKKRKKEQIFSFSRRVALVKLPRWASFFFTDTSKGLFGRPGRRKSTDRSINKVISTHTLHGCNTIYECQTKHLLLKPYQALQSPPSFLFLCSTVPSSWLLLAVIIHSFRLLFACTLAKRCCNHFFFWLEAFSAVIQRSVCQVSLRLFSYGGRGGCASGGLAFLIWTPFCIFRPSLASPCCPRHKKIKIATQSCDSVWAALLSTGKEIEDFCSVFCRDCDVAVIFQSADMLTAANHHTQLWVAINEFHWLIRTCLVHSFTLTVNEDNVEPPVGLIHVWMIQAALWGT